QFDALPRNSDPLGSHLMLITCRRVALHDDRSARFEHVLGEATGLHTGDRGQSGLPGHPFMFEHDADMRVCPTERLDWGADGEDLRSVVTTPAMMSRRRPGQEDDREGESDEALVHGTTSHA